MGEEIIKGTVFSPIGKEMPGGRGGGGLEPAGFEEKA